MKSLSWSPASLEATHWKRDVSETWARETISRRLLADTRRPSPCRTALPSLYHLCRKNVRQSEDTLRCSAVFVSEVERRSLRNNRWRRPDGLTLQLQGAVDDHRDVRHLVSSVNQRRNCEWGCEKKQTIRTSSVMKIGVYSTTSLGIYIVSARLC